MEEASIVNNNAQQSIIQDNTNDLFVSNENLDAAVAHSSDKNSAGNKTTTNEAEVAIFN